LEGLPDGDDSLLIVAASVSRYLNDIPPPTL